MKKLIILLITVLVVMATNAQDVVFDWAKQMGGINSDYGYSIAVDSEGNIYTTGYFFDTVDFDPGVGVFNITSTGSADVFITKLDASGNFVWAKHLGGLQGDGGFAIALDNTGNIYTTGLFVGTSDFDPNAGIFNLTSTGGGTFISKLDTSGNFVWAKQIESPSDFNIGVSLASDASGNVYATGYFNGIADFDPSASTFNLTSSGNYDIFILKLDASGNFVWAKRMGGIDNDSGVDIKVDDSGSNVYSTGEFRSTVDFDPNGGIFNLTSSGSRDIYISKLDASGNFVWAKKIGGSGADRGHSIAIDNTNNYVYIAGEFAGTTDFDPGAGTNNLTAAGGQDSFVTKLDISGNFVWARGMGGADPEEPANCIQLDSAGDVIVTGWFSGTSDFNPGIETYNLTSAGENDVYIAKLDAEGNFVWAKRLGGTSYDDAWSLALDAFDNIYTIGSFWYTVDFDPGIGVFNLTSAGDSDVFIHKMRPENLSISDNIFGEHFKLYPNPTSGIFYINGEVNNLTQIEIYSITGQKVMDVKNNFSEINIDELRSAIYFVKLYSEEGTGSVKIIKK
jgi:hypothetical protein